MPLRSLRILIFHGYLLDGTGSNVYNARLARALVELGHEVHLFTQDRHPERCDFVDEAVDWDGGDMRTRSLRGDAARCTVYRPDIGDLLPIYVQDTYEGLRALTFDRCSDAELGAYLEANVAAVAEVARRVRPDVALANHLVMGPCILSRALAGGAPYAVKVHGSALEYTVKRDPERFLPYAREGIASARGVLTGSRHTAESLWAALGKEWVLEHDVRSRTGLGPPGVDVHAFTPRTPDAATRGLVRLQSELAGSGAAGRLADTGAAGPRSDAERADTPAADAFARDESRAAAALGRLAGGAGPLVAFVGKLIVSKGIDLLVAAWPLVLAEHPDARLAIVGFGAYEGALQQLLDALADADLDEAERIGEAGRELEGGPRRPLTHLLRFLQGLDGAELERYVLACELLSKSVCLTGRLSHDELAELLPACEALVVPSTFPEAFGMVAAEAAACGTLPISAAHSGLAEVSETLRDAVPQSVGGLLSFPVDDGAVEAIADRLLRWIVIDDHARAAARAGLVSTVRERWSWEGVARSVIAAAEGRLDGVQRER